MQRKERGLRCPRGKLVAMHFLYISLKRRDVLHNVLGIRSQSACGFISVFRFACPFVMTSFSCSASRNYSSPLVQVKSFATVRLSSYTASYRIIIEIFLYIRSRYARCYHCCTLIRIVN